jgi:hypothetical protein
MIVNPQVGCLFILLINMVLFKMCCVFCNVIENWYMIKKDSVYVCADVCPEERMNCFTADNAWISRAEMVLDLSLKRAENDNPINAHKTGVED